MGYLNQLVAMNQQLTMIPHLRSRNPDARKASLDQELQNVSSISMIRLLLPNIAGTNLGRISDPHLVTQSLQQLNKPLIVADRFDAHERRRRQRSVESLSFTRRVHQPVLRRRATLSIEHGNLLKAWMEITTYDDHPAPSLPPTLVPKPTTV